MTLKSYRLYWKEIVGTILWIGLTFFLIQGNGWEMLQAWWAQF